MNLLRRLLFITIYLLTVATTSAEVNNIIEPEIEPELRYGVLTNGMRYYIRHNAKPKGQADFYLITDVGAVQEADDQQGLAHFLEHMAFNGTRNFPDKEIIEYLERVGVKFGANLNASTSWDVTTYMIKDLPVTRESTIDSALLILHDWAHFITPTAEEIDKERGVIKEELRTRDNADWRATIELIKALGDGTRYAERNLIGYLEDLEKFKPEALVRFYEEWYRPEYQAVIVVGDIDAEAVEAKLISLLSDIPPSKKRAPQKEQIFATENSEPIISIYTDPEMQHTSASIFIKRKAVNTRYKGEVGQQAKAIDNITSDFIAHMQNERFSEIEMQSNAPFLGAYIYDGSVGVIPTLESTTYSVHSEDGELYRALSALLTERERVLRHGYTASEVERARESLMSAAKSRYNNRADRLNNSFVQRYIKNFRLNEDIYSASGEWQIDSLMISNLTVDFINSQSRYRGGKYNNNVIVVNAPEKEGVKNPTREEILHLIDSIRKADIAPYEDTIERKPLISDNIELAGSKVVSTSTEPRAEAAVWQLENGVEVIVKPTILKADEVVLRAQTYGGASVLSDEDYHTALYLPSIMGYSGLSEFSATELGKQLAGKIAGASLYVNDYTNGISASSSVEDVETMLQLLYLNLSSPRFNEEEFEIFRTQMRAYLANCESDPDYISSKRFREMAYGNSPRKRFLTQAMIDSMSFDRLRPLHDKLFGRGADFRFIIAGSIDTLTLKPLVEKYLGSLPNPNRRKLNFVDDGVAPIGGVLTDSFEQPMQQPKVSAKILYSGEMEYNLKNCIVAEFFNMALDNRYLKSIREEAGGTYGVHSRLSLSHTPHNRYTLTISFDTNTEQIEGLLPLIETEISQIAKHGVDAEQMGKSREFIVKNYKNSMEHNSNIARYISSLYTSGIDYFANYEEVVTSITSDDIKHMAKKILHDRNRVEVIMTPPQKEEAKR